MENSTTPAEESADWKMPVWAWLLGVALLLAWQGWLTQQLFGAHPFDNLLNDQPLLSGTHPQNLYLGAMAARGGRTTVYVIDFQTGMPITPIFDGGRIAELFLVLGGGTYQPAAYKIGIASLCMLVPIFILIAAKALGLGNATSLLATFLGQLVWWGPHGRTALETGDCQLYMACLAALTHVGLLIAFHRTNSVWAWFGLWITASMGWFLQPLLFPIALPILLIYYLSVGDRHDVLTWHLALWTAEIIAVLVNLPWLTDWIDSWWLRTELPSAANLLVHRTFATVWNAPLWAGSTDRLLAMLLISNATVGVLILNQTRQRPAARLLTLSAGGAMALTLLGISWEPLGAVGTAAMLAPSMWFACLPTAHAWVWLTEKLWRIGKLGKGMLAVLLSLVPLGFIFFSETPGQLVQRCLFAEPFRIGLPPDDQAIVELLIKHTTEEGRILWEDRARPRQASRWSALLPLLTHRQFIGGIDPDGFIEHSSIGMMGPLLEGRHIDTWSEEELQKYCWRYNVCWMVVWSPDVIKKLEEWPDAKKVKPVRCDEDETGWLFEIKRTGNIALKGKARLFAADGHSITLTKVEPDNGEVIVSLHFQAGMRASPPRIQVERAASGVDPISFVRLRLANSAEYVTLSWER